MADQNQGPSLRHIALALIVDLGHQRAGGIEHRQAAGRGLFLDAPGHPMGAKYRDRVRRYFRQILDEDGTLVLEAFNDVFVVHDFVADIDRRPILLKGALDDLDRTHDAGTKAAGLGEIHFHGTLVTQVAPNSFLHLLRPRYVQYPSHAVPSHTSSSRASLSRAGSNCAVSSQARSPMGSQRLTQAQGGRWLCQKTPG